MMFTFMWYFIFATSVSGYSINVQRRVLGGKNTTVNHPYMAYLQKAESDNKTYVGWLCAGTIIGKNIVLTSAACVQDVQNLYVIAGMKTYVNESRRDVSCIEAMLKKVVHICVPKAYDLDYDKLDSWANYDIAVIKVESDIVGDPGYAEHCDYEPKAIEVNYEHAEMQEDGNDALILGWGHLKYWRQENDTDNYNSEDLNYVSTKIFNKNRCLEDYSMYYMESVIKKYMICTMLEAGFDDKGETIQKGMINPNADCEGENGTYTITYPQESTNGTVKPPIVGLCQNDHGGPLIAWKRNKQLVIGVASAFKVEGRECTGPSLFTSTYSSANFIMCVVDAIENESDTRRRNGRKSTADYCLLPAEEKGFDIIERSVSWMDHPDGPADNERINLRPQMPFFRVPEY